MRVRRNAAGTIVVQSTGTTTTSTGTNGINSIGVTSS
jgi:hypothetical protein